MLSGSGVLAAADCGLGFWVICVHFVVTSIYFVRAVPVWDLLFPCSCSSASWAFLLALPWLLYKACACAAASGLLEYCSVGRCPACLGALFILCHLATQYVHAV